MRTVLSGGNSIKTMDKEIRNCQNCKKSFVIEPEDFGFYEKIKVPPPTFCPKCRMIRRQLFRNERTLYKAICALCNKNILSMYSPEGTYIIYCADCYSSDKWDSLSYGQNYDFNRSFFEQLKELFQKVPRRALYQDFAIGSEYTNMAVYMNNCYLCFGGHHYEDCAYCAQNFNLKGCLDTDFSTRSDFCYDSINLRRCNKVYFSAYSEDCANSWFLFSCRNCHDCFGCTNLRNASFCIFNEQYSKEDYEKKIKEMNLSSHESLKKIKTQFAKKTFEYPRKYAWVKNIVNSTGDNLEQVKNCAYCFSATEDENIRYSFFVPTGAKDCYDLDHVGLGTENACEVHSSFGANRVAFGNRIYYSHDVYYSDDCYNSANLFGCVSIRKKEYCILNKQYSKEEYERIISKIIDHMNTAPYRETSGTEYKYGEFFPISIMPFAYNETVAQEYFPLTKEEALIQGFRWKDPESRNYKITIETEKLPDDINQIPESITNEIIACAHAGKCNDQCTTAFRIIAQEFQFYRQNEIPFPSLCPNCRHAERLKVLNPMQLVLRPCECAGSVSQNGVYQNLTNHFHGNTKCPNQFETPFQASRPEFIYCEQCYQAEVA